QPPKREAFGSVTRIGPLPDSGAHRTRDDRCGIVAVVGDNAHVVPLGGILQLLDARQKTSYKRFFVVCRYQDGESTLGAARGWARFAREYRRNGENEQVGREQTDSSGQYRQSSPRGAGD